MDRLLADAHVFIQGYRPGGLQALGYGVSALAQRRPGLVCVSLSAYGNAGPWAARRGFDSLLQTAMGFNHAEGEAAGDGKPRPMPMQIQDAATGSQLAYAACAALWRQQREGGSWHAQLSLAQTAHWLRGLGRVDNGLAAKPPSRQPYLETTASGFGELVAVRPSAQLERTPVRYSSPSMRPGHAPPHW
jgi:crotonobetainyl-CoA:carnitine CoA-transferase CaiB-like acyl-CoA transferase